MFQSIRALPNPSMGGHWRGNSFQFGLIAEHVISIRYLFFPHSFPQLEGNQALLSDVQLDTSYQFGDVWGWEAEFSGSAEEHMVYLIQFQEKDGNTKFVFDPFARESFGGEHWGRPIGFVVDEEDFRLSVISRPKSKVFHGMRRLPVLRQETPTDELTASRPIRPHHPLEQSVIYECHVRGMTNSPSISVSGSSQFRTYRGLVECIPYLKALGVTAIELLPVFDFDENERLISDMEI